MAGYQEWFDLFSGADAKRQLSPKEQQVAGAAQQKQEELRRLTTPQVARTVVNSQRSNDGLDSSSEMERDFRTLTGPELVAKYGTDVGNQLLNARAGAQADASFTQSNSDRSAATIAMDSILAAGSAAVRGVGGIAAWAGGEADPRIGDALATGTKKVGWFIDSFRSPEEAAQRQIVADQNAYAARDNEKLYQDALRSGGKEFSDKQKSILNTALGPVGSLAVRALSGEEKLRREGRNFVRVAENVIENPTTLGGVAADAAGSLATGGAVSKTLRSIGAKVLTRAQAAGMATGLGTTGKAIPAIGSAAAMPLAIGLQEGGGAYLGTLDDAYAALQDKQLPDDVKTELANQAATISARVQAPVGAVTGLLVSKFEAKLARGGFGVTPREALEGAVKETFEESIQSFSAQAFQNAAIQATGVDPNRDILAGTGEQTAYGALGGLLSSGGMSLPGVAVNGTAQIAKAGTRAAIDGLASRGQRLREAAIQNFTGGRDAIIAQANDLISQVTPEQQGTVREKINEILSDPKATITELSSKIKEAVSKIPGADAAWNTAKVGLSGTRQFLADKIYQALDALPEPERKKAEKKANDLLSSSDLEATPEQVLSELEDINLPISKDEVKDPANAPAIETAVAKAIASPSTVDPEVNTMILKHSNEGKITLTPQQKGALEASASLVQSQQEHEAVIASLREVNPRLVSEDVQNESTQAFRDVVRAVASGNVEEAYKRLDDFRQFAQLLQNKVNALNEHLAKGTGNQSDAVPYQNLIGEYGRRRWIQAERGMWMNPNAPKTVAFARAVEADARSLTTMANNLAKSFPELGFEPLPDVALNLNRVPKQEPVKRENVRKTPELEDNSVAEPVKEATPVTEEAAPVAKDTAQPKGGDQSVKTEVKAEEKPEASPVEQAPEPEVQVEPAPKAEPKVEPKAEAEAKPEPEVTPAPAEKQPTRFENLVGKASNLTGWFQKAFKTSDQARTKTTGQERPLEFLKQAFKSTAAFLAAVPDSRYEMNAATLAQYNGYLREGDRVLKSMEANLSKFLNKELSGKKIGQHLLDGTSPVSKSGNAYLLNQMINAKALNIVQIENGKIRYNPELVEMAVLAGLQWALTTGQNWSKISEKATADIFGMSESDPLIQGLTEEMNQGMGLTELNRSMAAMITRYWGVIENSDADLAMVKGISEAVAGEVLRAMEEQKLIASVNVRDPYGDSKKNVDRYFPFTAPAEMKAYPSAIEEAVMVEAETNFIGKAPEKVAQFQMNNPRARNTKDQQKALKAENDTVYTVNLPVAEFFQTMGKEALLYLFGEGNLKNRPANVNHIRSMKGRNLGISMAFDTLMDRLAEVRSVAAKNPQWKLNTVPIHYEHNFSGIGRMQQLGRNNPQSSKLVREAIMPTKSTLDLSGDNLSHTRAYYLSLAQALDIKVENVGIDAAMEAVVGKLYGDLAPAVDILADWLSQKTKKPLSGNDLETVRQALGEDREVRAFHALLDFARFRSTDDASAFETSMYLEADGKTNGPINAMGMMTPGAFDQRWIVNMAKGGLLIDQPGMSFAGQFARDARDLYKTAADKLSANLSALRQNLLDRDELSLSVQLSTIIDLMNLLNPGSIEQDDGGNIVVSRGTAKNPLTITLYGSSAYGIAGNLVGDMVNSIYERFSGAIDEMENDSDLSLAMAMFGDVAGSEADADYMLAKFEHGINRILTQNAYKRNETLKIGPTNIAPLTISKLDLRTFTFSKEQLEAMTQNMNMLIVDPLQDAIRSTVGSALIDTLENVRKATQVQGIVLEYAFIREYNKQLAKKPEGENLSQAEIEKIWDKLSYLSPMVDSGKALFDIAGSQRVDVGPAEFGRAFDDSSKTNAYIYGPKDPGVRGIPTMVIGMGDGAMMQYMSTMTGAVAGTLKVFDGVNLPLDKIEEGSRQANEAALQSWLGNPVQAVLESFEAFLKDFTLSDNADERLALTRALFDKATARQGAATEADLKAEIEKIAKALRKAAVEIEVKHDVLKEIKLTVDQMASAEAPHVQEADVDLSGLSSEQIASELNRRAREKILALEDKPSERITAELEAVSEEHSSGARIIQAQSLRSLAQTINIPAAQKMLLDEIIKSNAVEGYQIIFGSPWQAMAVSEEMGISWPQDDDMNGVDGFADTSTKTIFLLSTNPSSETLVHELLHGATFQKLWNHYNGRSLGANGVEQARAIERMEVLLDQFMELDVEDLAEKTRIEFLIARQAIQEILQDGSLTEAGRKAGALNEFMAYALTNQGIARTLERTKADSALVRIMKSVVRGISKLIWGDKFAQSIKDDMLSNLRFNTNVLIASSPSVQTVIFDGVLFKRNGVENNNTRLQRVHDTLKNKIVTYLNTTLETTSQRNAKYLAAVRNGIRAAISFDANGFPMTGQEKKTFQMVVAAMSTATILDGNVLTEINKLYQHVTANLKPVHFMADKESVDPNDLALAQMQYDSVVGNYFSARDGENRSALLSTFVALAMTNEVFQRALSQLPVPSKKLSKWNTLDGLLTNTGIIAMDKLSTLMAGGKNRPANVVDAVNVLTEQMVEIATESEPGPIGQAFGLVQRAVDGTNDALVGAMRFAGRKVVDLSNKGIASTSNKVAQALLRSTAVIGSLVDEQSGAAVAKDMVSWANQSTYMPVPVRELLNEFIGRTDENAPIYDMIKLVRSWVQQTRQQFREKVPAVINGKFTKQLTDADHKALFRGMGKTDLAALVMNGFNEKLVLDMIKDKATLGAEISNLEAALQAEDPARFPLWQAKMKELALYMNTGRVTSGNFLRNAHAIANLRGERKVSKLAVTDSMTKKIDALTSLYALDTLPGSTQKLLASLAQDEAEGMTFALDYLVGQRRTELSKASWSELAQENHYKGWIPSESKSGGRVTIDFAKDEAQLAFMGYQKVGGYKMSAAMPAGPQMSYYYTDIGRARYNQGVVQNVRPTFSGVDPVTGFTNQGLTGGQITDPKAVTVITSNRSKNGANGTQPLMPVYDGKGAIIAYELSVDPDQEARVERTENLAEAIGMWRGRQVEELQAQEFNSVLINRLGDIWRQQGSLKSSEFVNLFDPEVLKKDRVLADSVGLLNRETRRMIRNTFGKDRFMVRKDMLNDVLGYRSASIGDLWTGNTRLSPKMQEKLRDALIGVFGVNAYKNLTKYEGVWQNLITDARVTIVIKSMIVPAANLVANIFQLMSRGVGITNILKGFPKKTAEIDAFVQNRLKRLELEAELRASTKDPIKTRSLRNQIQTILDSNRRMSIWPLIEAGEFASISDVGISQDELLLSQGRISEYMEKLADRLPASLKTLGKYGIISRDTALFKGLQRAVEYGDFLGKAVMYDHLISKGMDSKEALAKVSEEFVNYDRLPGRSRAYLENIGALWFWNFKIRSTKIAISLLRNNPLHSLLALTGQAAHELGSVGSPITDNAFGVMMDGRSNWSIGPRMAIHAHALNPWYNLTT